MRIYDIAVCLAFGLWVVFDAVCWSKSEIQSMLDDSMEPTLPKYSRMFMPPLLTGKLRSGDVVGVHLRFSEKMYIRRIIGLPGEVVELRRNEVYINGIRLDEPYLRDLNVFYRPERWELGPHQYIVLADNRRASHDSRMFGFVFRKEIKCRMWWRLSAPRWSRPRYTKI